MSKMSEIQMMILEQIEDGEIFEEIAYNVTCEYPVDFSTALGWVCQVAENLDEMSKQL